MSKFVFAAIVLVVFYSAYRALVRSIERQRETLARAPRSKSVEPRDLGRLRKTDGGIYVPDEHRHH